MMDNDRLAEQLVEGLTSEQFAGLLARLLDRMPEEGWAEFCDGLDRDVASVFRRLLSPPPAVPPPDETARSTSDAKFAEQFQSVLGGMRGLLLDLGDEDGDYVFQENDWEQPDFDAPRLASDIERYAKDLLPLLVRAAKLELEDEGLFTGLCEEISDGIGMYPDHIYTEEGVGLERTATECVVKWLDLHADTEGSFLDKLVAFIDAPGCVGFDDGAILTYLLDGWPEDRQRSLYDAIQHRRLSDDAFRRKSDRPRDLWYEIRYALAGEFDVTGRTEIAEASVSQDWTKGVALVDAAVADGNSARALEFCRKTVDAYYQRRSFGRESAGFAPGTTPLFSHWGVRDESPLVSRILGIWAELSAKDGDVSLAELLEIQKALLMEPDDWTTVRDAFDQAGSADATVLLSAWKKRTLEQQRGICLLGRPSQGAVWPEWLIDAGLAGRFNVFTEQAAAWLDEGIQAKRETALDAFRRRDSFLWPPQMSLTADLFTLNDAPREYPTLKAMLTQHCKLNDCPARLEWLGKSDAARLTAAAVAFVRRNMARLIPSPGNM
ncbi:MAG: hypothetical protein KAI66_18330, partial [Lentisphaeria bacterium]|nr:hypothetical protein [Lentisphaeria bacterium]